MTVSANGAEEKLAESHETGSRRMAPHTVCHVLNSGSAANEYVLGKLMSHLKNIPDNQFAIGYI